MRRLLLALGLLLLAATAVFALDVPPHGDQWVVDTARLLPPAEKEALGASLRDYAERSGNQIVVLTIPGLEGEDLAAYANRVAREWAVGQKDANNGVLLLVSVAERKVRFEVGRGIEDKLPDITAKRIQQQITVPNFKAGRYAQGIIQSVAAIRQVLGDVPGEGPASGQTAAPRPAPAPDPLSVFTLVLLFVAVLLGVAYYRRNSSRHGGPGGAGGDRHSFFLGLLLGLLSSIFRGRGGGGGGFGGGGGGGGDGGFSGGGGDF
ncbi:MAG: TPM domain-containing protein, partial [Proteobacteria bacterium]|nr:TPM domain-containing protein [Pseudomonadota bacterium]